MIAFIVILLLLCICSGLVGYYVATTLPEPSIGPQTTRQSPGPSLGPSPGPSPGPSMEPAEEDSITEGYMIQEFSLI